MPGWARFHTSPRFIFTTPPFTRSSHSSLGPGTHDSPGDGLGEVDVTGRAHSVRERGEPGGVLQSEQTRDRCQGRRSERVTLRLKPARRAAGGGRCSMEGGPACHGLARTREPRCGARGESQAPFTRTTPSETSFLARGSFPLRGRAPCEARDMWFPEAAPAPSLLSALSRCPSRSPTFTGHPLWPAWLEFWAQTGKLGVGCGRGRVPQREPPRGPFGNLGPTSLTPTLAGRHHMPAPSLPPTPVALLPSPSTRPHASASALHTPPVPSHSLVAGEGAGILFALQRHFLCIRAVPSRFRCGCSAPALGGTPWACGQHPGTCTGLAPALLHSCDLDGREQQPSPSRAPFPHCLGFRGCSLTSSSAPPPPMQLLIRPIS